MIDEPIVFRPRWRLPLLALLVVLVLAPVAVLLTGHWIVAIVVAVALLPFEVPIVLLLLNRPHMTLTPAGVHLRTDTDDVKLAWADIKRFDCGENVVVHMRNGDTHDVPWMSVGQMEQDDGVEGYGDLMARELNILLMVYTGKTSPDGDLETIRPRIYRETRAGRQGAGANLIPIAVVLALVLVAISHDWRAWLLAFGMIGLACVVAWRRKRRAQGD